MRPGCTPPRRAYVPLLLAALCAVPGAAAFAAANGQRVALPARVIRVGLHQEMKSVAAAALLAKDGDIVELDPGVYPGDVAVWNQNDLVIRAPAGAAKIVANGKAVEGKGIWVIRGRNVTVEGIHFSGARVSDANGAGIRFESGSLVVRRCAFIDNQDGILTGNDPASELVIEDSEFGHNGAGDGQSHNLYVGAIRRLVVTGSYFHHAKVGHLLKSRARDNEILYNRLTDEQGGTASYELEFPAGGVAIVIGNSIEQGPETENSTIVSYGAEGYKWPENRLLLAHNTVVNDRREGGQFLAVRPGAVEVRLVNNIFVGKGNIQAPNAIQSGNVTLSPSDFASAVHYDYRLKTSSRAFAAASDPLPAWGRPVRPTGEFRYPVGVDAVTTNGRLSPGAFQSPAR